MSRTLETPGASGGIALLSDPFRPFFLLAALFAAIALPAWLAMLRGDLVPVGVFDGRAWHIHEMLFGYLAAVLAGFLFTAIPNWTGRLPLRGRPLALLVLLWLAGRVVVALPIGGWPTAVVDLAFLAAIAALPGARCWPGGTGAMRRFALLVTLFALANLLFHLPAFEAWGERLGLAVAAMLIGLVGGRIVPSFTRNWLAGRRSPSLPAAFGRFDKAALLVLGLTLVAWIGAPEALPTGGLLVLAAALHGARLARWKAWLTVREPLLLVLHLGYLWLVVALLLMGLAIIAPDWFEGSAALHALSAGAVGTMTVAVMTRATLGHSGRALTAGPATVAIFGLVSLGAALRVLAPALPVDTMTVLFVAGLTWCSGFALFVVVYGPVLASRRER